MTGHDGACWAGTARGILQILHPSTVPDVAELSSTNLDVLALAQDKSGEIWAGSRSGEIRVRQGGQWQRQKNVLTQSPVGVIAADPDGYPGS